MKSNPPSGGSRRAKGSPIARSAQDAPTRDTAARKRAKPAAATAVPVQDEPVQPSAAAEALKNAIVESLDADKAEDIVAIDLRGKSNIADFWIVASGRSTRQVTAMAGKIVDRVQPGLGFSIAAEGMAQGDWVLLDCGDVVVHLFRPEVRAFYAIEKIWGLEPPAVPASGDAFEVLDGSAPDVDF